MRRNGPQASLSRKSEFPSTRVFPTPSRLGEAPSLHLSFNVLSEQILLGGLPCLLSAVASASFLASYLLFFPSQRQLRMSLRLTRRLISSCTRKCSGVSSVPSVPVAQWLLREFPGIRTSSIWRRMTE